MLALDITLVVVATPLLDQNIAAIQSDNGFEP
jgi:hypothetical protein